MVAFVAYLVSRAPEERLVAKRGLVWLAALGVLAGLWACGLATLVGIAFL
jgi:hypothetical protein